jgi:hypothetical protein
MRRGAAVALGLAALVGVGGAVTGCAADLGCGDGTIERDGACIEVVAPLCGGGTLEQDGECVPDPSSQGPTCGPFTALVGEVGDQQCLIDLAALPASAGKVFAVDLTQPLGTDGVTPIGTLANGTLGTAYDTDLSIITMGFLPDGQGAGEGYIWGGVSSKDDAQIYYLGMGTALLERVTFADHDADAMTPMVLTTEPFTLFLALFGSPVALQLDGARVYDVRSGEDPEAPHVVASFGFEGIVTKENADKLELRETNGPLGDFHKNSYLGPDGEAMPDRWFFQGVYFLEPKIVVR